MQIAQETQLHLYLNCYLLYPLNHYNINDLSNINNNLCMKVSTIFPTVVGNLSKICDYPDEYTVNNTFIQAFRFKYGNNTDWYVYLPYFRNGLTFNINLKSDGIYVYISGTEVANFVGKELELYLAR